MDSSSGAIVWEILLQIVLIALNAVFACAEIAVISMNDTKLAKLAASGDKRAVRLAALTSQPARFLATIQVAITLSGFLGSAFAADNFSDVLVQGLLNLGINIPVSTLNSISVILITLILSYFTLVFGELVPKRIAMKKAESLALGMSAMITFISKLFAPLVWLLTISTNGLLRLVGIDPNQEEDEVTEEEIRMMVDVGSEKGTIDNEEKEMIQNVFEFDDISVKDICIHRTEVSLLWMDESMEQWEKTIHDGRHSRYPICNESVDDIVGVLNAKDYFRLDDKKRENVMESAVTPAYFVPENIKADKLFRNMKKSRNYFAMVLDEYGGVRGIITMHDLVQQLVGDIDDEYDIDKTVDIEPIDSQTWKILGSTPLEEVSKALGIIFDTEEFDTFGGFIFGALGSIPDDGTQFELEANGLAIKVIEVREHRVEKAIVCLASSNTESDDV